MTTIKKILSLVRSLFIKEETTVYNNDPNQAKVIELYPSKK